MVVRVPRCFAGRYGLAWCRYTRALLPPCSPGASPATGVLSVRVFRKFHVSRATGYLGPVLILRVVEKPQALATASTDEPPHLPRPSRRILQPCIDRPILPATRDRPQPAETASQSVQKSPEHPHARTCANHQKTTNRRPRYRAPSPPLEAQHFAAYAQPTETLDSTALDSDYKLWILNDLEPAVGLEPTTC